MILESLETIHELLSHPADERWPRLRLLVLRNVTLEPMEPYLRFYARRTGLECHVRFGEYDAIVQEAIGGPDDRIEPVPDMILVVANLAALSPRLSGCFAGLAALDRHHEEERIEQFVATVLSGLRRRTQVAIVWCGFETPGYPALGLFDSQTEEGQGACIHRLNAMLRHALRAVPSAYYLDMDRCLGRMGTEACHDWRYWHSSKAPYSRQGMAQLASEIMRFARALSGKPRKCLVLDCDNTLWGGIIGEDGLGGIRLGHTASGSAYWEFQQEILNLHHRGIILALCSKNNEDDVWTVFDHHPDMVLQQEHIAAHRINWEDKASNIRRLAIELNIGLDSMVFVDDSEFECQLIRQEIPEVEVLLLPGKRPTSYRQTLLACGLFDSLALSQEDRRRGAMYQAEAKRKAVLETATDLPSYYRSLQMEVDIRFADDFAVPRLSQQTQKTNQFNLTTRRYTEAEIRAFMASPDRDVVTLGLRDRFGDYGLVGMAIVQYAESRAEFDTLLVSCRALGRGVETVFLRHLVRLAKARGNAIATGVYLATPKNGQAASFYLQNGFVAIDEEGQSGQRFQCDLSGRIPNDPDFFATIRSEIDQIIARRSF